MVSDHPVPTEKELRDIGDRWDIVVTEAESKSLAAQVSDRLEDDLNRIYDVPVPTDTGSPDNRFWTEGADEYNAIAIECHIPPVADDNGLLDGYTIGVKDLIRIAGIPMRCGSTMMHGYIPSSDATVITRIRNAGGRITAKTTLDEFAGGGRGRTSRGLVLNPRNPDRIAGGSSGGSGAAVAADFVDVALGTDTGGSTRKPAAFCGLVGFKPTYGLIPLTGVVENTYSLDHIGIIASVVDDIAVTLEALSGKDPADPASMTAAGNDQYNDTSYSDGTSSPPALDNLTIGIASQGLEDEIHEHIAEWHDAAISELSSTAATVTNISLPYLDEVKHIKNVISYSELAAFWRSRGSSFRRPGWDDPFNQTKFARHTAAGTGELNQFYRSRMLAGAYLYETHAGHHYARAKAARNTIRKELAARFEAVDVILTPTVPDPAPTVESVRDPEFDYDGLQSKFGFGRYTKIANVTGTPALTIPIAQSITPAVGLQVIGSRFSDNSVLAVGARLRDTLSDRLVE